jgi:SAM-dependent methyltransferase
MELTDYDGIDPVGEGTLEALAGADNFNKWTYDTIAPYIKGELLEIGSGIGNISQFYLRNNINVTLTDLRTNYCDILQDRFKDYPNLRGIKKVDLVRPDFAQDYGDLIGTFDTIVASNVVEHIENAGLAIGNCMKLLRPGGHVIIIVPAYQALYNQFDKGLGHFKRYSRTGLNSLLESQGFGIIHSQYFNCVGIAGWFVSGSLLKKKMIPGNQMSVFNKLITPIKLIDKIVFNQIGLSTISIGKKPF